MPAVETYDIYNTDNLRFNLFALDGMARAVTAHVSNQFVPVGSLHRLIVDAYAAFEAVYNHDISDEMTRQSDAEVARSRFAEGTTYEHAICMECGGAYSGLSVHIVGTHKMTLSQYKKKWGNDVAHTSKSLSERRRKEAFRRDLAVEKYKKPGVATMAWDRKTK